MGWFKKSEVELQCFTGEGLRLGLARIIGENLEKNEVREISLLPGIGRFKKSGI